MIECTINGICLKMYTDSSLFSPNFIDKGTITMVSKMYGGSMVMVTKRDKWYRNKLKS